MHLFTSPFVLLLVPGVPLLLAMSLMSGQISDRVSGPMPDRFCRITMLLAPWAALPALAVSLLLPPEITLELPWLVLGTHLGLDETARVFLFFTALLWLVAGIYTSGYFAGRPSMPRFLIWFLLTMTGNLGLIVAQDMIGFYSFFALMSLASYGLVVHERSSEALRAGRVYIVLVVAGEVLLFTAFTLAALTAGSIEFDAVRPAVAESELRDWVIGLTLLGFGIKAGAVGLHVWLPLAHPVAPTPASAVLSGAMIAAGLLGWMRVLPLGETALPGWGAVMIVAGVVAGFYAVLVGLLQNNPKTVLAYSSVSKMGIMTIGVGLGLAAPDSWPLLSSAILIYALHHGLAKGALFLGVGIAAIPPASKQQRRLLCAGLLLPALSLAAAPLTGGMIAKNLLKVGVMSAASPWKDWLPIVLSWGSVATTLLMARFLTLVWPRHTGASEARTVPKAMWLSWGVLLIVVALLPWFIPYAGSSDQWSVGAMFGALLPVAVGGGIAVCARLAVGHSWIKWSLRIPPGDVLVLVEDRLISVVAAGRSFGLDTLPKWRSSFLAVWRRFQHRAQFRSLMENGEDQLGRWVVGTTLLLVLGMLSAFLAAR